jgi:L-ascorbate metabolism protein UlaG (beta-lactamase superfamily)
MNHREQSQSFRDTNARKMIFARHHAELTLISAIIPLMSWRRYSDWAKRRPMALRVADRLGRGRGRLRWLDHVNAPPRVRNKPDLSDWNDREFSAVWIGHATVLLKVGELTILTDPVFSNRVGVGLGLATGGPRRFIAPALSIDELPKIDLVLLSHAHFDHLDRPTLNRLPKRTPIVTAHRTRDLVADLDFRHITELRWGESQSFNGLKLTAREVNHWGARTFHDTHRGFNAYLIESRNRRIVFGGDTAYHDRFRDIGPVDLAILGIGAYDPWVAAHATPEQAWKMADHLRADFVLPMHHSTFRLSYEPMNEPIERLLGAAGRDQHRVVIREIGAQWLGH